ncbi:MAG: putative methylase [Methanoculleus sp.]|nr:putative methylase [Methanoculleus sp.]
MTTIKTPKKLIEVALPLVDISAACAYEKMPGIGAHPRGLHLWWARRPLAAARAVLFAQLVNDPGYERHLGRGMSREKAEAERERLFAIIRELVKWKNTDNETLLAQARAEIQKSWQETCYLNRNHPQAAEFFNPEKLPAFHDPFAGGGAIPLEAQRLGLEACASDLNPVAVLINKAMIEIPPKFAGRPPGHPKAREQGRLDAWQGATGLAEDVRHYGQWMRDEAERRIGHLYPKVRITEEMAAERPDLRKYVGEELTVIAWLWARTVKSPNPAYVDVEVPLVSSFWLSNKEGKEAYIEPVRENNAYRFNVRIGTPSNTNRVGLGTKAGKKGATFRCIFSESPIDGKYIKSEGQAGRMGVRMMAIVAEGRRGRVYLSPTSEMENIARKARPTWTPSGAVPERLSGGTCYSYGFNEWGTLFTPRQLVALNSFSDLIGEARDRVKADALAAGMPDDGRGLEADGDGATAYSDAVAMYLAFAVDRAADFNNICTRWVPGNEKIMNLFSRQAIPMVWDFGEANILENVVGGFITHINYQMDCLQYLSNNAAGQALMRNASQNDIAFNKIISTDPPYYDNIGYSDLSDFFYVWLRRSLKASCPSLFATMAVPKAEELVALPHRHGSKVMAEKFFIDGMTEAMRRLAAQAHPAFPVTIYYAFKQSETKNAVTTSRGWEAFLEAVLKAGFTVTGTWPMRSEQEYRIIGMGTNALASSIVLVCRKRDPDAAPISRTEFIRALKAELPEALEEMTGGKEGATPIAPVDLAQASIGPGMAVYSRYPAVLEADGTPLSVHDALILINRALDEHLAKAEGDLDPDTRFCIQWFEEYGWKEGPFGTADTLARAKGTSVDGVTSAGVLASGGGKVRLLRASEYPNTWDLETDPRIPVWEALHHLSRTFQSGGEVPAGELLAKMPARSQQIRQLAYRLYTLCDRKGWADDARTYNELITTWHPIETAATDRRGEGPQRRIDQWS